MALDNAEFISELSIADPPGTDPLNQGDDHIRTTKKAVQQSFPNVNAAVPQTAAQMGQMAIKNEINTFTQRQLFADGTVGVPSIAFGSSPFTGLFLNGVNSASLIAGGIQAFNWTTTVVTCAHRLDMNEKIRFNNFADNHGLSWRANGALTWELIAVHSNAPLTRLTFDRYVGGVFQDQPLQLHNDTGHVNMPVLPTNSGGQVSGSLFAKPLSAFASSELVMGVAP